MINKKLFVLVIFVFLLGCGYQPIFSSGEPLFSINKIELTEKNKLNVIENNLPKLDKTFSKTESYNTKTNKFELKKIENQITLNLVNKMIEEIIIYLHSI